MTSHTRGADGEGEYGHGRSGLLDRTIYADRVLDLSDRVGLSPPALGTLVIAALVAVGWLVWAAVLRPPSTAVEASLPQVSVVRATTTTAATAPAIVVVHAAGAVADPGVYSLDATARVLDLIEAAGGLRNDADASRLNLAAPLADGARLYVPAVGEEVVPVAVGPEGPSAAVGSSTPSAPIDLNAATPAQLESLPGVGPATAAAIVEHRSRIGRFESVEGLLDVPGIGEAKLAGMRDSVVVR